MQKSTPTSHFFVILLCLLVTSACAVLQNKNSVEVLSRANQMTEVDLTARHHKSAEYCVRALSLLPQTLMASIEPLSPEQRSRLAWPANLKSYQPKHCQSFKKRGQILSELNEIFSSKEARVGVILPDLSPNETALQTILAQMKKQLAVSGFSSEQALVIRRAGKEREEALKVAAELVHIDRVAILVGGLSANHASAITQMADLSQTPALLVSPHAPLGLTRQSMRVYPPIKRLAKRLAESFQQNKIKTVTALYPLGANIDLYDLLRLELGGGYAYSQAAYDPENPQSILNAVRSQASRLARSPGRPAVVILDNFRMVRHIVNILATSLPANEILFAGNQQWRSPALVVPREETLQGAIFVDFIGNYRNLPYSIETPISDSDYFTTAQAASKIDYQIIGHRLGSLAGEAARFGLDRHDIAKRLQSINNRWDPYFPKSEPAIDQKKESSWPVFLFQVSDETIKEI